MIVHNRNLNNAKQNKDDEFYTQLCDIENELQYYTAHFKGKVVYCNCDNESSNFVKYFTDNYDRLGLAGLLVSGITDNIFTGDFRSYHSIELLKQADIVVTNPPFSLFREYLAQLIEYDKKFLILGNMNTVTCKDTFPLIKDNKMWLGVSLHGGNVEFGVPRDYIIVTNNSRVDDKGNKYISVNGVRWFTNLEHNKHPEPLILYKKYYDNESDYPKYDNYDAIEVSRTCNIPIDYEGAMGVPISFLDKYCPSQFKIIGLDRYVNGGKDFKLHGALIYKRIVIRYCPSQFEIIDITESNGRGLSNGLWNGNVAHPLIRGTRVYTRIFIRNRNPITEGSK